MVNTYAWSYEHFVYLARKLASAPDVHVHTLASASATYAMHMVYRVNGYMATMMTACRVTFGIINSDMNRIYIVYTNHSTITT